jgi:hypothetical protein
MALNPSGADLQGVTLEELKRIRGEDLKPVPAKTKIITPRTHNARGVR